MERLALTLTEELAGEVVYNYLSDVGKGQLAHLKRQLDGTGCGCKNCLITAVREFNDTIDWILPNEDDSAMYKWQVVVVNGRLTAVRGT